jgi:hypothetical protein
VKIIGRDALPRVREWVGTRCRASGGAAAPPYLMNTDEHGCQMHLSVSIRGQKQFALDGLRR